MINVSSSVKTACDSDNLKYKEYILVGGQTVEIRGKMSNSCYNEGNIFGTFIMKKLEFTTENDIDYKGKEVVYYKSVNGENFKIGTYIVTEIKDNDSDETVTVTALDYAIKTAIPYVTNLDYASGEVTLFDVITEACSNAGLTLKNTSITNGDFIVDSNQFTDNELIGDVIKAVAHISGNFSTINEDDEVELVYEEETDEIIEDYEELADKRDTLPITSLSIGTSQVSGQEAILRDEDMISEYGEHWLVLNDNPFAYTLEKRQELVTAIFNKVKGFSYSSFESKYAFKPYLQLGDKVQFKNKAGELVNSRILKIDTDYDDIKLSAPSIIKATVDYKNSPNAYEVAKRAEVIANQATSSITSLAEEQTQFETKVTENLQNIEGWEFKIQQTGGENLIQNSTLEFGVGESHTYTGDVEVVQDVDIKKSTLSKSAIKIANGSFKTNEIDIIPGQEYTHSLLLYKNELTNVVVTINSDKTEIYNIECEPYTWQELSFNVLSNNNKCTIEITADDSYILVADRMLNKGEEPLQWQRFAGEIVTDTIKINNKGLMSESSTEDTTTLLNSSGIFVKNKLTGNIETTINKDLNDMNKSRVRKQFNIGKLRHTVLDNGDVLESWDD